MDGASQGRSKLSWNNAEARDALARYEPLVRRIARRLLPAASAGRALDEEDLCAEGRVAVLEALSTYQGFGIEEQRWVAVRIRQRIIDSIRRLDLRSRDEMRLAVRHAAGEVEAADENERARMITARRLLGLDSGASDSQPLLSKLCDSMSPSADRVTEDRAMHRLMMESLEVLSPRQREALELTLFHGMSLREIGSRMGVSESRVCQLQKRAVEHLHRKIADALAQGTGSEPAAGNPAAA